MKVNLASKEDILQILEISKNQFEATSWQINLFEEEIGKSNHYALVGKENDEVVCFLFAMKTYGVWGEDINILNLATKKGLEKKGYATELLLNLQEIAKKNLIRSIWLEVRENNLNAIKFYKNFGFKIQYIRKKYYSNGDNAYIMNLQIKLQN